MMESGLTITQAIKASMQLFGVGLGDAKSIVASHPSWSQTAQAAQPFQDALIQAFRDTESREK
jgi:ribosomal protein L7/L12